MNDFENIEDLEHFTALANEVGAFVEGRRDVQTLDVITTFAELCDVLGMPWPTWMMNWDFPEPAPAQRCTC